MKKLIIIILSLISLSAKAQTVISKSNQTITIVDDEITSINGSELKRDTIKVTLKIGQTKRATKDCTMLINKKMSVTVQKGTIVKLIKSNCIKVDDAILCF